MRAPKKMLSKKAPLRVPPLAACLAKTRRLAGGGCAKGRDVVEHNLIAWAVAAEILRRFPNIAQILPKNADLGALLHDIGKICPTFLIRLYTTLKMENFPPELKDFSGCLDEAGWGGHAAVSAATLMDIPGFESLAPVVGSHHGRPIKLKLATHESFGGESYANLRREVALQLINGRSAPAIDTFAQLLVMLGLTIVADWIASGEIFDDPGQDWRPLVETAVDLAGFISPQIIQGLRFEDIFPFPPNAGQRSLAEMMAGPGIYILEAPMGLGKTEAALYAAYMALSRGWAGGIYFALPTQITSNRIYERVNDFLAKILLPGSGGAVLVHANAWLQRFQRQEMGVEEEDGVSWFEQGKRGILAPFAVGTIDQALMAVMRVKHAGLRAFGLAGKVVILDEVHSYDAYMGCIIDELAKFLKAAGCTVIILSATLTESRRKALLLGADTSSGAYPMLTALGENGNVEEKRFEKNAGASTSVHLCHDDSDALEEALARAEAGQQVLWIENTVGEAQEMYKLCAARAAGLKVDTGLVHSRFIQAHRDERESRWTGLFGKNSPERARTGRILFGTQVLEQSLDIDADFLISRFCPTDMILQRMGRLWRHERPDRHPEAKREAWLLAPGLENALEHPKSALGKSALVYNPYVLCRSLEIWNSVRTVELPGQIRDLLEATYREKDDEPTRAMSQCKSERDKLYERMRGLALQGVSAFGQIMADEIFSTRLSEIEQVKVLLLSDADFSEPVLLDGSSIELTKEASGRQRRQIAAALARCTVSVPIHLAPDAAPEAWQKQLRPYIYEARAGKLRIAVIDAGKTAHDVSGQAIDGIFYTKELGYYSNT